MKSIPQYLKTCMLLLLPALILMVGLAYGSPTPTVDASELASVDLPLPQPEPIPAVQGVAEWTIMLYQDADDEVLEQDIMVDFNEAEVIGSTDQVNIVAQVDRYEGAFDGMGDWTSTKRFYVTQDSNLSEIGSEELEDLGEVNMADSETLVDFIAWSVGNFPAKKYALIMSDHGAGWPGGWNDPDPGGLGPDPVAVAELFGVDGLWLMELDQALAAARAQTGIDKFDLIGFDACLMSQLEVYSAMVSHGRYSVASQEVEPAVGWAYASFLEQLTARPQMSGADLSKSIVASYIDEDQRIVDDGARQEMLDTAFGGAQASAAELAAELGNDVTLSAIDLAAIPAVNTALNDLTLALSHVNPEAVAEARAYAQAFESVFGEDAPSPYIDLAHFMQLVVELSGDEQVTAAANKVAAALDKAILAEKHGPNRPGATGVTIHFPTPEIFGALDNFGYTTVAGNFAEASQWDDFLANFHSGGGQSFSRPQSEPAQPELPPALEGVTEEDIQILLEDIQILLDANYTMAEVPQALVDEIGYDVDFIQALLDVGFFDELAGASRSASRAAGPKPIQLAPLTLSAEIATPTEPVTITTEISGDRLAYVYTFIGRFLPRQDVLLIEDMDYLIADDTRQVGGVAFPAWPEEGVSVEYVWEPTIFAINDGKNSVKALLRPQSYDPESPTYAVEGTYTFKKSGDQRYAKMYFRDGEMTEIFGFTGSITQAVGAPRQITPQTGDTFTVLERGDDLSLEGEAGRESYTQSGGVLTFSGQPFIVETTPAPSGNYVVGFIAEDLNGATYEQYEGLFVVNEEAGPVDGFVPYVSEDLGFALLYPQNWTVEENPQEVAVDFFDDEAANFVSILKESYPDAASPEEANELAIQAVIEELEQDGELKNLQFLTEQPEDFVLGAFDAKIIDFDFELDGEPLSASVIVSTPVPEATYLVLNLAPTDTFETAVADSFDPMIYSFDLLISGVSKEQVGPPPPDAGQSLFSDDFSKVTSGLFDDQEAQEWGRGYYAPSDQYLFEMTPNAGPIYDYYAGETLPADFLLQATAGYEGAVDNGYGLVFQVQPGEELDQFYTFRISGDGFYTVEKTEGDQLTALIDWTPSTLIDQAEKAKNVLTVEGRGDAYNLYINGRQVNSFTDADFSKGTFGFIVDNFDEKSPVTFTFDDLAVNAPAK
jgi:hypothetical protein